MLIVFNSQTIGLVFVLKVGHIIVADTCSFVIKSLFKSTASVSQINHSQSSWFLHEITLGESFCLKQLVENNI